LSFFVAQALNGLVYGSLLFLLAAGLSLIFGLMNVVNLAHGSFFMVGAFAGLGVASLTGSYWLALLAVPILVGGLGMVIETLLMRRLYRRTHLDQVLLTFGFTFVAFDLVQSIAGSGIMAMPIPPILQGSIPILGAPFPLYRLFLIALSFGLGGMLWLLLDRSHIGAMVRAGVDDRNMAAGIGINVGLLFTGIFALGAALAGLAGVIGGPELGVYAGMDVEVMVPAFIVIVIGGMGTLTGAFAGSLLVGEADTFGKAYIPDMAMFLIYLLMIGVLLLRPTGLFGRATSNG
jgi:branched-subunit amino acid ABC-type transport system permease component